MFEQCKIPRCYFQLRPVQFELHGFSDASNRAYAGAVYIQSLYEDGGTDVRLVASKTRVAPLKGQTIPRLELLGALILARLVNSLDLTEGNVKTVYWTDSTIKNENFDDQKRKALETICTASSGRNLQVDF